MIVSKKHRKIILADKHPERITTVIPTARLFEFKGRTLVSVPHKLDEVRVLRNMGIIAPSPISCYYEWSGQYKPFAHQQVTAEFLTTNASAFVLNQIGCVDSETEYLSPTGWKRIAEYEGGDVMQFDPKTRRANFVAPLGYVKEPCQTMVRVQTKYGLDQMLSHEHRVLVEAYQNRDKQEVVAASELLRRHNTQHLGATRERRSLSTIAFSQATIPTVFSYSGSGIALSDAQLRVQVAVAADGYFPNKTNRVVIRLKKQRKIDRLRHILADAGISARDVPSPTDGYRVLSFDSPTREKVFGPRWFNATQQQLRIICDEVMHWDGSIRPGEKADVFSTTEKQSADFIQFAFCATGSTTRIHVDKREYANGKNCYGVIPRIGVRGLQMKSVGANGTKHVVVSETHSTDGFKYCFSVPTGFLVLRRNGCVFCTGNSGKTLSLLWAVDYLMQVGALGKLLIVSPLSTLERVWGDEIYRHFTHLNFVVLHGSAEKRRKLLAQDADIYIINHDGLEVLLPELLARTDIDAVVVDEIAEYRNAKTDRWRAANAVLKGRKWKWGMTGSPTPRAPTDAWSQCRLIAPARVPNFFTRFRDQVMRQVTTFKWMPRPEANRVVQEAMQPAILFTRDECLDLPPCTFSSRHVEMGPEQKKAYKDMMSKLCIEHAGGRILAVNESVMAMKLVQIASGCVYSGDDNDLILPNEERIKAVLEIIEQAEGKVIVYVPLTGGLRLIADAIAKAGHTVATVHGATNKHDRDVIFSRFQSGSDALDVLVAHPQCMAHGLTLTKASVIIWYIPTNNFATYEQACGRITRQSQTMHQHIIHLEGSAIEQRMYRRLETRGSMQGALLGLIKKEMEVDMAAI